MPKTPESTESKLQKAIEAAQREENPIIAKIAREYGVNRRTLYDRVKKGATAKTKQKPVNKALTEVQEEILVLWIIQLSKWYLHPTPRRIKAWANYLLLDPDSDNPRTVGPTWVYRFMKRVSAECPKLPKIRKLPKLTKQKQNVKELKRIQAENVAEIGHWYDQLYCVLRDKPSRLVYNFDECGFQPGEGKNQNVFGLDTGYTPDTGGTGKGETITAIECIAADGWSMDPLFIFKGTEFQESWFTGIEMGEFTNTKIAYSPNGWVTDELSLSWLKLFIKATDTPDRLKKGESRVLLFDGHRSHLTLEFLQTCQDNKITPFGFLPHTTHLCQPLDGKPFLAYKQIFRCENNDISYWSGMTITKALFLKTIHPVRQKAFHSRIVKDGFRERGIYPVDSEKVLKLLPNQWDLIGDLNVTEGPLARHYDDRTPSPALSSSSIEYTPPKTLKQLERSQEKITKYIPMKDLKPKVQRGLEYLCHHAQLLQEECRMLKYTVERIRVTQEPLLRPRTKRQLKQPPLQQTGILGPDDALRSIYSRQEKENLKLQKKLKKQAQLLINAQKQTQEQVPEQVQEQVQEPIQEPIKQADTSIMAQIDRDILYFQQMQEDCI